MSLIINKAGLLDSIQDTGRYGFQYLGINPTGAMDKLAAQVANLLVGNDPNEAVIEMHFPAPVYIFEQTALIALSGADFSPCINGEPVPMNHPIIVTKSCVLHFRLPVNGVRAYMAIRGGLDIQKWLNSTSTNLKAKIGGFHGRPLQKNDELQINMEFDFSALLKEKEFLVMPWQADMNWDDPTYPDEVFVLPGNEWNWLSEKTQQHFLSHEFSITPNSDRMGYRLGSGYLETITKEDVISSAVIFGTIQLLPGKQLIILMADHQTAGGYPKIAHIIKAHHSKVAQMKAGESINFRLVDQQLAELLLYEQHQHLVQIQNASKFRLDELFK
jgi:antagonist of KipI